LYAVKLNSIDYLKKSALRQIRKLP
ncbi:hypothetical protein CP8484711_2006, partial [Chlamydia psittaci 84-8471/1]